MSALSRPRATIIALIGAGGTGKTTVWEQGRTRYGDDHRIAWVPEAARTYFTARPWTCNRFGFEVQQEIQQLVLANERQAHSAAECLITDRSAIDAVAYVWSTGNHVGARELLSRASEWLPAYRTILLCSADGIPFTSDQVRTEDASARAALHEAFIEVLTRHQIPHKLLSGNLEQRVMQLNDEITKALENRVFG